VFEFCFCAYLDKPRGFAAVPLSVLALPADLGSSPVVAVPPATPRGFDAVLALGPVEPLASLMAFP
jgi:hypothetical protein